MRRVLAVLVTAILSILIPTAAMAATSGPTFTLDTDLPTAQAVADVWSKNTGVNVVLGECSGDFCIHAALTSTNTACGDSATIGGCASWVGTSCNIEVSFVVNEFPESTTFNILGHEVGHCLTQSAAHLGERDWDLMEANIPLRDDERRPGPATIKVIKALYAD